MVRITFTLVGDAGASFSIVSKSANVHPSKILPLPNNRGRTQPVFCNLNENGEAEMELTIEVTGDGDFNVGGSAFGNPAPDTKERPLIWVDCTGLTVNGKKQIPGAKVKVVPFSRWRRISRNWNQTETVTYVVKASFAKVPEERAAKLTAQDKKARKK